MLDGLQEVIAKFDVAHCIPFAAMVVGKPIPENRPAMTRLIEQGFVGIVAAALASYVTLQVQANEIINIKRDQTKTSEAIKESEARVTDQIRELRVILIKRD